MNKAVTVLHCDRFCIIIANCPSPHSDRHSALSLAQHHILASLVKGRWIDGKAQTVALLLSACDMSTLFILQTFLPSRRRDCTPSAPSIRFSTLPNTKIRHLSKHRILYIQFSALVKMVSGSKAIMF